VENEVTLTEAIDTLVLAPPYWCQIPTPVVFVALPPLQYLALNGAIMCKCIRSSVFSSAHPNPGFEIDEASELMLVLAWLGCMNWVLFSKHRNVAASNFDHETLPSRSTMIALYVAASEPGNRLKPCKAHR
jgi:hypothetical protein